MLVAVAIAIVAHGCEKWGGEYNMKNSSGYFQHVRRTSNCKIDSEPTSLRNTCRKEDCWPSDISPCLVVSYASLLAYIEFGVQVGVSRPIAEAQNLENVLPPEGSERNSTSFATRPQTTCLGAISLNGLLTASCACFSEKSSDQGSNGSCKHKWYTVRHDHALFPCESVEMFLPSPYSFRPSFYNLLTIIPRAALSRLAIQLYTL